MASKSLFTAPEQSAILLMVLDYETKRDADHLLEKLERLYLDKLFEQSEVERLLKLSPK